VEVDVQDRAAKVLTVIGLGRRRVMNPLGLHGASGGSISMGLGMELQKTSSWQDGKVLTDTLKQVPLPTHRPDARGHHILRRTTKRRTGPYGAKGGGRVGSSPPHPLS